MEKSFSPALRLHQLAIIATTIVYYLFLAEIKLALVPIAKRLQLADYKVAFVRGEIDNIVENRECEFAGCDFIYQECPFDMPLCSNDKEEKYFIGLCCDKEHGQICSYECIYINTIEYILRYSDKFIPVALVEAWQNVTGIKKIWRGTHYEQKQFLARLHRIIQEPVEVYFPLTGGQPLWDLPPLDTKHFDELVDTGMLILIAISLGIFVVKVKHFYGFPTLFLITLLFINKWLGGIVLICLIADMCTASSEYLIHRNKTYFEPGIIRIRY